MSAIVSTCRTCGREFEAAREAILRGEWHTCSGCRPTRAEPEQLEQACTECGRPLRDTKRTICLSCLTGGVTL